MIAKSGSMASVQSRDCQRLNRIIRTISLYCLICVGGLGVQLSLTSRELQRCILQSTSWLTRREPNVLEKGPIGFCTGTSHTVEIMNNPIN